MITLAQLQAVMAGAHAGTCSQFLEPLNAAMAEFDLDTSTRQAAFLAQIGHESLDLRYTRELADGHGYEHRADLGNIEPGDGVRFKGRGLIQITGRLNYAQCGAALELDLLAYPELLELPEHACRSAAWFWASRHLNDLADAGDFLKLSVRINGRNRDTGLPNGWADRQARWERAKAVLA